MMFRVFVSSWLIALLTIAIGARDDKFPDGPGKAQLVKVCSGCHDAEIVLSRLNTPSEWAETLQAMAELGAEASPEDWRAIEGYIDANFALIAINKATAGDLQKTLDVTPDIAAAIVKYRQENGAFTSTDDVKKVPEIDAAKIDARAKRFVF